MWLVNLIPEQLKWWLWWLVRPKYLVGVFVVVFRFNEVLVIQKKRGVTMGYQIPGGGKDRGLPPMEAALKELREETGLKIDRSCLRSETPYVSSTEEHRDVHIVYVANVNYDVAPPLVQDTFEVASAKFVHIREAEKMLIPAHAKIMRIVLENMFG